jgi:hypothetical protein
MSDPSWRGDHHVSPLRHLSVGIALVLVTSGWLLHSASAARDKPTVEIFASQQPILLGLNQPLSVILFGAVYDQNLVDGVIDIAPNGPQASACPIFLTGISAASIPGNTANAPFSLVVRGPSDPGQVGQTLTCALRYRAFRLVRNASGQGSLEPVDTKGNEVRFQYTVKRRPI